MSASWPYGDDAVARIAAAFNEALPGSVDLGVLVYLERLLTALDHDPPRIWAAPPGIGDGWLGMGPWERVAWSRRIEDLRQVINRVAAGEATGEDRRVIYTHACHGTYGDPAYGANRGGAGWAGIGFPEPMFPPARSGDGPGRRHGGRPDGRNPMSGDADCDAIVIGSGPGGATAAEVLTAAGWSVIVLEKGRNHLVDLEPPHGHLGHFANDELALVHRHLLGPDPLLEPRSYRRDPDDGERLFTGEVNNLPSTVGGGGFHADAKLPRFREEDFTLRSSRGPVDGADVQDWPITYDDLEPHYGAVEEIIGVAGETGTNPFAAWRSTEFPMAPGPDMPTALVTAAAAERAGLHPYRAPTGINSVVYDGRPACVDCGFCGRYGCPVAAKGDPIAPLQRMLRSGLGQLRPESLVTEIVLDRTGRRATGVRYRDLRQHPDPPTLELRARHAVIVAGGAFETARLLLRNGLGVDLVGRYLTYHFQTYSLGVFARDVGGERGRDVTHLHDDLMIDTPKLRATARDAGLPWVRGGVTEHGSASAPIEEAMTYPAGALHGPAMTDSSLRRRMWVLTVQGEDLAQATNRIDLDPTVVDAWGLPAGRVTYRPHRHELVASDHAAALHEAVLTDAGADLAFSATSPPQSDLDANAALNPLGIAPASRHVMGTARMGKDPTTSVVSPEQRLWDVDNVLVCDSSVFVTSTGYNPTLTLAALAHRAASRLIG